MNLNSDPRKIPGLQHRQQNEPGLYFFPFPPGRLFIAFLCLLVGPIELHLHGQIVAQEQAFSVTPMAELKLVRWSGTLPEEAGRTVQVRFALFEDQAGGFPIWSETQLVKTDANGSYTALLGATSAEGLPLELFQSGEARWIEVQLIDSGSVISSQEALDPKSTNASPARSLLAVVPYAFKAKDAETLAGRGAEEYMTRDDLQSAVASEFQKIKVTCCHPLQSTNSSENGGAPGIIPVWTSQGTLGNSVLAEYGTNLGIGTTAPATILDVNGASTLRGAVGLLASAATMAAGVNSPPLQLGASTYSSATNASVPQNFVWQALSTGNDTANPAANLHLLFGSGADNPLPTGLSISPNGQITFAPGQTFPSANTSSGPGGNSNGITAVMAGPGLTGGGSNGAVTLGLSTPLNLENGGTGATTSQDALTKLGAQPALGYTPLNPASNFNDVSSKAKALSNLNGTVTLYPEWYGAVGDDVHDDTAAFQATFAACPSSCTVQMAAKTYKITGSVDVAGSSGVQKTLRSLLGTGKGSVLDCQPKGALAACVRIMNGSQNTLKDFATLANSNVQYDIEITAECGHSSEQTQMANLWTRGGKVGYAIGPDTNCDVSHTEMFDLISDGAQIGFLLGNGSDANVLDNNCYGCTVDYAAVAGVQINGGGFSWYGGGMDENTGPDFLLTVPSTQAFIVDGIRSENSPQFFSNTYTGSTPDPSVQIRGVTWFNAGNASPATYAISSLASTSITISDSYFIDNFAPVQFYFHGTQPGHPEPVYMSNVGTNNPSWGTLLSAMAQDPRVILFSVNDYILDKANSVSPGSGKLFSTGSAMFYGGITSQSSSLSVPTNPNGPLVPIVTANKNIQSNLIGPAIEAPTYTPGKNVTSCNQSDGYTNSSKRGELTIDGGKAEAGTICTVNFPNSIESTPGLCTVWQSGGDRSYGLAHGRPTKSNFAILANTSIAGATLTVDYFCQE